MMVLDAARKWAQLAQQDAPRDQGRLAGEIKAVKVSALEAETVVNNQYAHIMEWGSKGRTKVPADLAAYASTFRGKPSGGDIDQFFLHIFEWVKRKGIAGRYSVKSRKRIGNRQEQDFETYDVAYMIMLSILKNGVKPHPFFFIQRPAVEKQLRDDLNQILKIID